MTTSKRGHLLSDDDRNSSSNNRSNGRSSSFHKAVTKLVVKGLQELSSLRSSRRSNGYNPLNSHKSCYDSVPPGYLAVYVGEQQERFIVRTDHLHHPIFKVLLKKCEEEFGFSHQGPLQIPCQIDLFHVLLWHIENSDVALNCSQAQELVDLYVVSLENL